MYSTRILLFAILLFQVQAAYMQSLKGRLTDSENKPVPFAAIYDDKSYTGTTSNADGYYQLKLPAGKHSIVYKSLGYFVERRSVDLDNGDVTLNIRLKEQAYELSDVIVKPGKEDPAYAIMRKVIGKAPYHLNLVKEYSSDVYLRGSIHIINMPKFISKKLEVNGKKGVIKTGDVYLIESINQIDFKAPDSYNQKVKSYRSNFPGSNTVNPMPIIKSSFYQTNINDAISPLAPTAFSYYKYRYEGYSRDGENVIFKIKVIPKRKSQILVNGYIYIIDQLWCLHSVDVSQEMFYGTVKYKEIFSPVKGNAWLPISFVFDVNAGIMGIKADYKYTSSVKYQKVQLNEKIVISQAKTLVTDKPAQPSNKFEAKKLKNQQEIEKLMSKEKLNNRDMVKLAGLMAKEAPVDTVKEKTLEIKEFDNTNVTIEKDAMKKDTAYWNTARPIPLTKIEEGVSQTVDSVKAAKDSTEKRDTSATKKPRKISSFEKIIFGGAGFSAFDSTTHVQYKGLIGLNKFDFNTVDGFVYKQNLDINIRVDSFRTIKIKPGAAYTFSRRKLMWWLNSEYDYAPLRRGSLRLDYSKSTVDYNQQTGMNSQLNALTSLFFRRNYKKFFEEHTISLSNAIDIANGLTLSSTLGYRAEEMLNNNSDFSFFYRKDRDYTPNIPSTNADALLANVNNREAYVKMGLEYTPEYFYRIYGGRKHYQHSRYPTFFANYTKAVPGLANSDSNYDYLEIGARQTKNWGMMHSFSWNVTAGTFLSKQKLFLTDYKFFNNQPLPVVFGNGKNSFFLPSLYNNYTSEAFVEGHVTFSTPYLVLKYLPFISNKIWLENLQLNYLYKNNSKLYWEAGYSLSQIYAVGGIGVYAGFKGSEFESAGVRLIFGF